MPRPTAKQLHDFLLRVDHMPELRGAGIGYVGDGTCAVLRPSNHRSGLTTFVIVQEEELGGLETPAGVAEPDLTVELVGLGLNCGGAVLSWAALLAEGAAAPMSGGASLALTLVTYGAATATTLQCLNSIVRSVDTGVHKGDWTKWLDSQDYYLWTSEALDLVSLAGAVTAGAQTVRALKILKSTSSRSFVDLLKGLSRAERKRLTQELIRMQVPGISNSAMKELIRAGKFPARFTAAEITEGLFRQLRDAMSATLAFTGSAVSGDVKLLYVHIFQE